MRLFLFAANLRRLAAFESALRPFRVRFLPDPRSVTASRTTLHLRPAHELLGGKDRFHRLGLLHFGRTRLLAQRFIRLQPFERSLIGLFGLLFGAVLLAYIITTVEVDMVMFDRTVGWTTYVLATVMTIFFSLLVNLLMNRVIRKIDMVESMKAGE